MPTPTNDQTYKIPESIKIQLLEARVKALFQAPHTPTLTSTQITHTLHADIIDVDTAIAALLATNHIEETTTP